MSFDIGATVAGKFEYPLGCDVGIGSELTLPDP